MKFPTTQKMKIRFEEFKEEIKNDRAIASSRLHPEFSYSVRFDGDDKKYFAIEFNNPKSSLWMSDINRIFKKYGIEFYSITFYANSFGVLTQQIFHCKFK